MKINGINVNVNFKKGAEDALAKYHKLNDELDNTANAARSKFMTNYKDNVYTPAFSHVSYNDAMKKALEYFDANAHALNVAYNGELKAAHDRIITAMSASNKPSDYAAQIGNALMFLQIEGENITDESAASILSAFQSDYSAMQRFKRAFEQITSKPVFDTDGTTKFPAAFGKLARQEAFVNKLSELNELAGKLFTYGKTKAETNFINGTELYTPTDRYMQLMTEKLLLETAESVDTLAVDTFGSSEGDS